MSKLDTLCSQYLQDISTQDFMSPESLKNALEYVYDKIRDDIDLFSSMELMEILVEILRYSGFQLNTLRVDVTEIKYCFNFGLCLNGVILLSENSEIPPNTSFVIYLLKDNYSNKVQQKEGLPFHIFSLKQVTNILFEFFIIALKDEYINTITIGSFNDVIFQFTQQVTEGSIYMRGKYVD